MAVLPTVAIRAPWDLTQRLVINEADFDPAQHMRWEDPLPEPQEQPEEPAPVVSQQRRGRPRRSGA